MKLCTQATTAAWSDKQHDQLTGPIPATTPILQQPIFIHGKEGGKTKSPKRKKLLEQLRKEIERTKENIDANSRRLSKNISRTMQNSTTQALVIWLETIRSITENSVQSKRKEAIQNMRAQPITKFLVD